MSVVIFQPDSGKMSRRRLSIRQPLFVSAAVLLLGGCSTLPHFEDSIYGKQPVGPTVNQITKEVQCELLDAFNKGQTYNSKDADHQSADQANKPFGNLAKYAWVVSVDLTLDVTDDEGLNPSLSYIDPLKVTGTNFTTTLGAQFSEEQHRNINLQFTLFLDSTTPTSTPCEPSKQSSGLRGDLGIAQIVGTGLPYVLGQPDKSSPPTPYIMKAIGIALPGQASANPVFGSTVDFSLVYGLGGTPTWTLTHFVGPGGASGDLVTAMRTHKDTLTLSFTKSTGNDAEAVTAATKAAQDNITRMILQRLFR